VSLDAVLTIVCPDRPGIVAAVSGFLAQHGANIVDAQQYSEQADTTFFMRVVFEAERMDLARREIADAFGVVALPFAMRWRLRFTDEVPAMGILVSRFDHCLIDLLARHRIGELQVRIPIIISNHPDLQPIAAGFGIPFQVVPVRPDAKAAAEERQLELLGSVGCDFVVLARYMQVLSPRFLDAYADKTINIHHGFLPAFSGARAYHQAHVRGVKLIGATSHYVTEVVDEGPIIDQDVIRVSHRDSIQDLIRKGRDIERVVLARAVRAHAQDRVVVHAGRTVVFE
jgi:formyltetrahydrofolate deformylase